MALMRIHLSSRHALRKMTSFSAIVPEGMPGPFPTLYLLHGLSDDSTTWVRRTNVERYVEKLPLIVVMPDGGRGWYTDSITNPTAAVETFIVRDLIGFVDTVFSTVAERRGRAICGQSMGGFGAFKLALKHPGLFCAAASMSGAFLLDRPLEPDSEHGIEMRLIFGPDPAGGPEDISALIERVDRGTLPALWMDCGTDDALIEHNRALHSRMQSLDIAHEYAERPGGHTWDYWEQSIVDVLRFVCESMGIDAEGKPSAGG